MLYYLFDFLYKQYHFPGAGMFQYISFRAACAVILALFIAIFIGKRVINYLHRMQVGETVRDLGLQGQIEKSGTPTMGGIIILVSLLIPVLLFADLCNIYIILLVGTTIWLGLLGFIDDYIKVFKKDKEGLHGKFKIIGQVTLGIIVALTMLLHPDIKIRESVLQTQDTISINEIDTLSSGIDDKLTDMDVKSLKTTIPFFKNHELDYSMLSPVKGKYQPVAVAIIFILVVTFVVAAVSNGANLTDGLDGLATCVSAPIALTLAILAYVSGNMIAASYLNIMYIPLTGEMVIFIVAFMGALIGFLWYNTSPAQVFMGDTGSLAIGGIIAVYSILIRKELLLPLLCGIFLVESLSVIIQTFWFKYTRKKYGAGRRVFLMAPLHHHYQKKLFPEQKIVTRFCIVAVLLAIFTLATLKIR